MRIRALPISEWSTGEVCGHVCKRGSRDRRVSGICVVSTLAVCVRSSLNAGPEMTCPVGGGALPTAREVPRGSNSVHAHASGTRSAAQRGICRVTAIVCCSIRQTSAGYWPPSIRGERLHESAQRRSMGGRGLWHGHTARARRTARGGDLARSNFGLCEGVNRGKAALVFFFTM